MLVYRSTTNLLDNFLYRGLHLYRLLDNLLGDLRHLLDVLMLVFRGDILLLLDFGLVDILSFDGLVLNSLGHFLLGDVFNIFFLVHVRDVFRNVLDGIVVRNFSFLRNIFSPLDGLVFDD